MRRRACWLWLPSLVSRVQRRRDTVLLQLWAAAMSAPSLASRETDEWQGLCCYDDSTAILDS